jgi:hypothetical protein
MEEWGENYDRDDIGLINLPGIMFRATRADLRVNEVGETGTA